MTCQCWERETDATIIADVKVRMKAKRKSKKSDEDSEDDEAPEDDDEEEFTMEDVLEAQENLPAIFNTILTHLTQRTKFSFLVLMGYTSPEPEDKGDVEVVGESEDEDEGGEEEGEDEGEENMDLEDQDKVDADPFADEPEDELEALKGQSEEDVLDEEQDGKQDGQEQIPDIYSPKYTETMHDTLQPATMHGSIQPEDCSAFQNINMHGSVQPEDHSAFQNINMHGFVQPADPLNLAMHDGNSYFMDTTNFHRTGTQPADLSLLFGDFNFWAPVPTGQYNLLENFQSCGQAPSYPQPLSHPQPCGYPLSQQSNPHPSDTLPPLPPVPSGNGPANPHPSDMLPSLTPIPSGNSPASPHPSDTLPPLPPVRMADSLVTLKETPTLL
ncbi:hypothetical protein F4604DRAFT_1920177 [Suillus subluteus]|nr:hypothetical protein F4604DRAFT_1920177 [Suillus subluteus]